MVRSMEHESFYTSGTYYVPEMGVYGGWVALEGSFAAGQVFFNEQKDIALLFAGECFPNPESQTRLRKDGDSRAEKKAGWLVHLYEEEGDQFFEKLNGLFGGLLIDKRRQRAFLFNDRYGLERIYLCETKDGTYFASEAKALLRVLPESRAFDEKGVAQFVNFGCTLDRQTLFRGVQLLPGGSLLAFEGGSGRKERYFFPASWESLPQMTEEAFESKFEETFKRILPGYFGSESNIGVSLTGGLDTRMIMACLPGKAVKPVCYTFAGPIHDTLDARLAARVAGACGLAHRTLRIGSDFFFNFATYADRTVYLTDGCFGVLGAHEIYLNEQARSLAPVRLTGVFGSEVLRGVSTFKPLELVPELFNPEFGCTVESSAHDLCCSDQYPVTFAAFREIPWNIFGSVAACRSQVNFRTPYLDNEIVALAYQAPESLRRSPLLALRFLKNNNPVLSKIPTDRALLGGTRGLVGGLKRVISEVTFKLDYLYSEGLPQWLAPLDELVSYLNSEVRIFRRHRYLHYRPWFRNELAAYLNEVVSDSRIRLSPFWNADFIDRLAQEHTCGRKNYLREINAVLTLEAVERLLFRGHCGE
jgi:asparagine synthase (glutamine-hydrolysing)